MNVFSQHAPPLAAKTVGESSSSADVDTETSDTVLLGIMANVQSGRLGGGRYVQANSWAGAMVAGKPDMQVKMESFIESCSFKTGMAGAMGKITVIPLSRYSLTSSRILRFYITS